MWKQCLRRIASPGGGPTFALSFVSISWYLLQVAVQPGLHSLQHTDTQLQLGAKSSGPGRDRWGKLSRVGGPEQGGRADETRGVRQQTDVS
ncbi:unnamed protein product [Lota lota]